MHFLELGSDPSPRELSPPAFANHEPRTTKNSCQYSPKLISRQPADPEREINLRKMALFPFECAILDLIVEEKSSPIPAGFLFCCQLRLCRFPCKLLTRN